MVFHILTLIYEILLRDKNQAHFGSQKMFFSHTCQQKYSTVPKRLDSTEHFAK